MNLFLSMLFFAISFWMATYITLPYFAIGGIHYYWYDDRNFWNFVINILIPLLIFAPSLYLANHHFGKALSIVRFPIIWIALILLSLFIIVIGFMAGGLVVFWKLDWSHWTFAWFVGMLALFDFLMCSVLAAKTSLKHKKPRKTNVFLKKERRIASFSLSVSLSR